MRLWKRVRIQKPIDPGESRSRRSRERPRDTSVTSPMLNCADDPPACPGPRGPNTAAAAPPLRDFVRGDGIDISSTYLPTPR